jgi:hypothetical protein
MNKNSMFTGRWLKCEIERYEQAVSLGTLSWVEIAEFVGSRTPNQCKSHHQKMIISKRIFEEKSAKLKKPRKKYGLCILVEKETQCDTPSISSPHALNSEKDTCETLTPVPTHPAIPHELRFKDLINLSHFDEPQPEDYFDCLKF